MIRKILTSAKVPESLVDKMYLAHTLEFMQCKQGNLRHCHKLHGNFSTKKMKKIGGNIWWFQKKVVTLHRQREQDTESEVETSVL